jgi:HupE / UreJ protein
MIALHTQELRMQFKKSPILERAWLRPLAGLLLLLAVGMALAHNVDKADQAFLTSNTGLQIVPFIYLGAKHMVTGYDHLLFLVGVIFFLYRLKEVALYVTLFAIGHSVTLLFGVLGRIDVNPYIIDAIIGFSVVYKAFDNLNGFRTLFGFQPEPRIAVLIFGLFHGFGLATKLQELQLSQEGLVPNMIAFNVGVEIGQFLALGAILLAMNFWRGTASFLRHAYATNVVLMTAGFVLAGYQMAGYALA